MHTQLALQNKVLRHHGDEHVTKQRKSTSLQSRVLAELSIKWAWT